MELSDKELKVAALENGTVIDHIPSEQLFKVVSLLHLDHLDKNITIGNNLCSKKNREKGNHKNRRHILQTRRYKQNRDSGTQSKNKYHQKLHRNRQTDGKSTRYFA